ncbi:MAG: electron transport complex subunit RsxA [Nitrospirae bacterium CG18_big_fil_WC_8_21_14_2_50_70_55]|nr:electron transport complex subunit RsxA [Deltaproteobacteria bacterium]OIP65605.1 MAG: electron transport complex subunit RsxA [Nitrospirae bacterium CG2_30_70_394]PIQ04757.1 MAG: electron transport complex subunit RsxA [Nitrospirae bacterium CG18_big_fil_WC_8_21_14_2_50_70_55]PIU78197.1 MAG: electron transport complex subunit RsxA [Nitrospirae bacterium CG06_land_8_20_14_3_00_70_43]PIW82202.1 MAG: electron transport complex subunit RsxA [Nitrospirae bacterium CG_4_8_14_3_um_filter_70_85]PI
MLDALVLVIGAILVNNFVLARFLGICPFLGVSQKVETSLGMSAAVTFVMTMSAIATWLVYRLVLVPLHIEYLKTIAFILVIAALVQFVEMVLKKTSEALYETLGIYLPLITTNCAILGIALLSLQQQDSFIEAAIFGFAASVGFGLALLLFAGLRERIVLSKVPEAFQGNAIKLVTAGLLSLSFMGFSGIDKGIARVFGG